MQIILISRRARSSRQGRGWGSRWGRDEARRAMVKHTTGTLLELLLYTKRGCYTIWIVTSDSVHVCMKMAAMSQGVKRGIGCTKLNNQVKRNKPQKFWMTLMSGEDVWFRCSVDMILISDIEADCFDWHIHMRRHCVRYVPYICQRHPGRLARHIISTLVCCWGVRTFQSASVTHDSATRCLDDWYVTLCLYQWRFLITMLKPYLFYFKFFVSVVFICLLVYA